MKLPWKLRNADTGRVLRSYATSMSALEAVPKVAETEPELEIVGPDGMFTRSQLKYLVTILRMYDGENHEYASER